MEPKMDKVLWILMIMTATTTSAWTSSDNDLKPEISDIMTPGKVKPVINETTGALSINTLQDFNKFSTLTHNGYQSVAQNLEELYKITLCMTKEHSSPIFLQTHHRDFHKGLKAIDDVVSSHIFNNTHILDPLRHVQISDEEVKLDRVELLLNFLDNNPNRPLFHLVECTRRNLGISSLTIESIEKAQKELPLIVQAQKYITQYQDQLKKLCHTVNHAENQ